MSKKRKRRFILACVLSLSIRSTKVNADLFVEGFNLPPVFSSKLGRSIGNCPPCYGIQSRVAASAGSNIPSNHNRGSYFDKSVNCHFPNHVIQQKYNSHAEDFGIIGNNNGVNRKLFRDAIIKHMKENICCIGTHRTKQPVYHFYNPDNDLNVMVDRRTNKFVSAWRLSIEQIENLRRNGNIQ